MLKRVHFVVYGIVQGVNFRRFTCKKAFENNVTGWCRNTSEKTVEGEAQAEEDALDAFFRAVRRGPPAADVMGVEKLDRDVVQDESEFDIRR